MSDNVVKTAAEELKKWLDVLQQLLKEKQAYDAKQAAKLDKAEMRQLQETRHEQMMAKFDKLANNSGDATELKKAVEEAQKEIQTLRKQLDSPEAKVAGPEAKVAGPEAKVAGHQFKVAQPEAKLEGEKPKLQIGAHRKTGTDAGLAKDDTGKWKAAAPSKNIEGPKMTVFKAK